MRFLILLAICFLLAACGTSGNDTEPQAPETDDTPANVSAQAVRPDPDDAEPAAPRTPKILDPSEWTIDESIETPVELRKYTILAKVHGDDDITYIIYEKDGRKVQRRIRGLGAMMAVDEQDVP
ncbi:MAG: hypothetical protein AAF481_11305 [Acidobacteriota bacterium]